jgi:hypothetical protein
LSRGIKNVLKALFLTAAAIFVGYFLWGLWIVLAIAFSYWFHP